MSGVDSLVQVAAATTAGLAVVQSLSSSGPANSVSAASGATGLFGSFFSGSGNTKLPVANPLLNYASYTYQIGLGVLTNAQINNPNLYMKGNTIPLILKDASASPQNRVKTPYGTFEFYIDNLEIDTLPVLQTNAMSNVTNITFKIIEPYSMGMFMVALQTAAAKAGHQNWIQAPFIITIDFKGNKETGTLSNIPKTSRRIPIKLTQSDMTVNEQGCVYSVSAIPWNGQAYSNADAGLKTNIAISGKTVQEILQTGPTSLQAVINAKLKQQEKQGIVNQADEIVILFPRSLETGKAPASTDQKATTAVDADSISKQIGVTRTGTIGDTKEGINKNLIQSSSDVNELGASTLGFSEIRQGDTTAGKEKDVWKENSGVYTRGNLVIDPAKNDMRFTQNMDIFNVINQVLMISDFSKKAMKGEAVSDKGTRPLWTIDAQVFNIDSNANLNKTGMYPRLIVYRVARYEAHTQQNQPVNTAPVGVDNLKKTVAKSYNYIYTGKNVDIINFNIKFDAGFVGKMGQAKLNQSQDITNKANESGAQELKKDDFQYPEGKAPPTSGSFLPGVVRAFENWLGTDFYGGGGPEDYSTRVMRSYWDAVTSMSDMVELELEILGDPYYIIQSGLANYSGSLDSDNLHDDGSMAYQNGQVFINVNFRTPVDINLTSGMYDFGKSAKTGPVQMWSGLYRITEVHSKFQGGTFLQTLDGIRLPNQEFPSSSQPTKDKLNGLVQAPPNGDPATTPK